MQTKEFKQGEVIFREGDDSSEAYRLVKGDVEISISTRKGQKVIAKLSPGVFFGEMGLIDDKPRSATATALTDCRAEVFHQDNFTERLLNNPNNLHRYLSTLCERIRSTDVLLQLYLNRSSAAGEAPKVEHLLRSSSQSGASGSKAAKAPEKLRFVSLSGKIDVEVAAFPFHIGRAIEGDEKNPLVFNDLFIPDEAPFHVSRHHCVIENTGDCLVVRDRGSRVGTIVNGVPIGADHESLVAELRPGKNTLVLGAEAGPHHFTVTVS